MNIVYAQNDYLKREQEKLISEIKSVLSTCSTLDIYCAEENGSWGIWLNTNKTIYLVDVLDLVNSIFMDDVFYMLSNKTTEKEYRTVEVHKEKHCFCWTIAGVENKETIRLFFNFQEYTGKIKTCVEELYAKWLENNTVAYDKFDLEIDGIKMAVEQLKINASLPSYYRLLTKEIIVEPFVFEPLGDEWCEKYKIAIGNRGYDTWLTHWDNNFERIRHQFESIVYKGNATIELTFDMSDTVLKISSVSVLDEVNDGEKGYGFKYKDYALVEIQPNEFVHMPIIKGYCDKKKMIQTFYEGLLRLAMLHPETSDDDDVPCRMVLYNKLKSPIIEAYLRDESSRNDEEYAIRQVHVKGVLKIDPDFDVVIWDSENVPVDVDYDGNIEELYDKQGNPIKIPSLLQWQEEVAPIVIDTATGKSYHKDWKDYHRRGLELAKQLRDKLTDDYDLWYEAPFEDKSGTIPKPILII